MPGPTSLAGQDGAPDPGHDSRITYVAVRTSGRWRFAAFQNTRREAEAADAGRG